MITTTYNYSSGSSFTYNTSFIGFSGGYASLLPIANPGQIFSQNYASGAGFTYNSSYTEFTTGNMNQLAQAPSNLGAYFSWDTMLNGNYGNGSSLIVNSFNSAAISSSQLNLTGYSNKYVTLSSIFGYTGEIATWAFEITPSYSGDPTHNQILFSCSAVSGTDNYLNLYHSSAGTLILSAHSSTGSQLASNGIGTWNPTSGTTYTFVFVTDFTNGNQSLYINGVLFGNAYNFTGTRTAPGIIYIGGDNGSISLANSSNFSINAFAFYPNVALTSGQISGATPLSDNNYIADSIILPVFTYTTLGNVQSWTSATITDSNSPGYILNGNYWNGTAWVTSNGTYAQSNISSIVIAHIASLAASNSLIIKVITQTSINTQMSCSLFSVNYIGQIYPTDPYIYPIMPLTMDSLSSFIDVESQTGSDGIGWFLHIGAINYWFNNTAWVTSNKTFAQSNTAAQIQANASTLPISAGAFVTPNAILHSANGLTTPTLTSLTLEYDYFGPAPPGPNQCTVFGYIQDGAANPIVGAVITVTNPSTFINQGVVEAQGLKTATTNSNGYFHFNLNETTTVNVKLQFTVVYPFTGVPSNVFSFGSTLIPNVPEVNFSTLTFS